MSSASSRLQICYIESEMTATDAIYIGTSGGRIRKGEGTWNGNFYPPGTKNELEYYSRFFDTVEINSYILSPTRPCGFCRWVRKTPDNFLFTVKLWQKFTHPKMYREANRRSGCDISG